MKRLKPGQLCTINKVLYRAKKRTSENFMSCTGCALNNPFSCPNIAFQNVENRHPLNCDIDGLIFVKV